MRSFFIFFRRNLSGARLFSTTIKMSGTSSAAALYAAVVSTTQPGSAVPEDVKELKHHVKGGKGFTNPWESYADQKPLQIVWAMARYVEGNARHIGIPADLYSREVTCHCLYVELDQLSPSCVDGEISI